MAINRVFFNWDRPGLPAAVDYLVDRFGKPGRLDLDSVAVVVPGGRAGRRLLEILVQRARQQRRMLQPPAIATVGTLPERLYTAKRPFAEELVQQLAWVQALKRSDVGQLKRLMPATPAEDDLTAWLALGAMLGRLHRELAADGLSFEEVAHCGQRIDQFPELQRWQALAEIQKLYLDTLDGLGLWDRQTARLFAIRQVECRTDKQIVLVGLVDMNRAQRLMLDQVADRVTALVFAPEELADRFDDHGCVRPEAWQDVTIDLGTEQIEVVDDPADQAAAVVRAMASWAGRYAAEQITVGVPDDRIRLQIRQQLQQCGVLARYGPGIPVSASAPYRLLEVLADHLEDRRFVSLAALVRHPDVQSWLAAKNLHGDWLSDLDRYHTDHLPYRLPPYRSTGQPFGKAARDGTLTQLDEAIEGLLSGLRGDQRPLEHWGEPLVEVLLDLFGQSRLDRNVKRDRTVLAACERIHAVLREHSAICKELTPKVSGADAIRLLLDRVAVEMIAPLPARDAVELLGWLELPLDDAPALIVTGFNEGTVPQSVNADLFLPNQLRRELGIEDNGRRYARDAYALSVLAASREQFKVIAGRRTAQSDPLSPSRLLFACDDETVARRAKAFFSRDEPAPRAVLSGTLQPGRSRSEFEPPRPQPLEEPVDAMRVTEFKDYLACPYRYYLKHRLKLRGLADSGEELDPAAFGSLAHEVLKEFGQGPVRESTDAEQIERFLSQWLDRLVLRQYGKGPRSAVRVQVEQLRRRLAAFAGWQADWAGQGWRIENVETGPEDGLATIKVDGRPMVLRGRIDRIDFNQAAGKRIILDYKSSDTAKTPEKTHRSSGEWIDLQLPLYRHLARGMGLEGPVEVGYLVLPKNAAGVKHLPAEWTDDDLLQADGVAEDVVRKVRAEVS